MALLARFAFGVVGTIATAVRAWKTWRVAHLTTQLGGYAPGAAQWLVDMTHLIMMSFLEVTILTICANAPALASWLKHRQRQRRQMQRTPQQASGASPRLCAPVAVLASASSSATAAKAQRQAADLEGGDAILLTAAATATATTTTPMPTKKQLLERPSGPTMKSMHDAGFCETESPSSGSEGSSFASVSKDG
jgi:hypothetical protein